MWGWPTRGCMSASSKTSPRKPKRWPCIWKLQVSSMSCLLSSCVLYTARGHGLLLFWFSEGSRHVVWLCSVMNREQSFKYKDVGLIPRTEALPLCPCERFWNWTALVNFQLPKGLHRPFMPAASPGWKCTMVSREPGQGCTFGSQVQHCSHALEKSILRDVH